jgi:regulatory protein
MAKPWVSRQVAAMERTPSRPRRAPSSPEPQGADERSRDPDAAREAALRLLERTRRTRSDLAKRLRDRGYAAAAIEQTLDRLAAVRLVDDVEYACAFLRGRASRRPAGRRRLELELRARGVGAEDIARAFDRNAAEAEGSNEEEGARRVLALAERRYRSLDPRTRRQRLYALLMRRGFDRDTIEAALRTPPAEDA